MFLIYVWGLKTNDGLPDLWTNELDMLHAQDSFRTLYQDEAQCPVALILSQIESLQFPNDTRRVKNLVQLIEKRVLRFHWQPPPYNNYCTCVILTSFVIYWAVFNLSYILGFFFSFLYSFSFEQNGVRLNYKDNFIYHQNTHVGTHFWQFLILF